MAAKINSFPVCIIGIALFLSICKGGKFQIDHEQRFAKWSLLMNKIYPTAAERIRRFEIFSANLKCIEEMNVNYWSSGMIFRENMFADLTVEEFASTYLMPKRPPVIFGDVNKCHEPTDLAVNSLPKSFDWNDAGVVTSVRDQGSAGTCWAFSAVQNIEGQWARKTKEIIELSVEQVVDCDGSQDLKSSKADCGVFGGWPYLAYSYVKESGGIQTENDYPYCCGLGGNAGTCYVCPAPGYNKTACGPPVEYCKVADSCSAKINPSKFVSCLKIKDWVWFQQNETEIAQHLMEQGPLSVAMNAAMLQYYHSGVYDPLFCDPKALDHAVLITGFGEEKSIFGKAKPYWKVKNSWGKDWGENGYFRIARGNGKCGINTQVTSARLE